MVRFLVSLISVLGCLSVGLAQEEWGTLKGRVEFVGKVPAVKVLARGPGHDLPAGEVILDDSLLIDEKSMGIANVVVWLTKRPANIHPNFVRPDAEIVKLKCVDLQFDPHVLVMRTDQTLSLTNEDRVAQNVRASPIRNPNFNFLLSPLNQEGRLKEYSWKLAERLPISISSDIHPWMRAHVLVVDHPYATVTDLDGNFEIQGIPVGPQEVSIWHERVGWLGRDPKQPKNNPIYTIEANEVTEVPVITLTADKLTR